MLFLCFPQPCGKTRLNLWKTCEFCGKLCLMLVFLCYYVDLILMSSYVLIIFFCVILCDLILMRACGLRGLIITRARIFVKGARTEKLLAHPP